MLTWDHMEAWACTLNETVHREVHVHAYAYKIQALASMMKLAIKPLAYVVHHDIEGLSTETSIFALLPPYAYIKQTIYKMNEMLYLCIFVYSAYVKASLSSSLYILCIWYIYIYMYYATYMCIHMCKYILGLVHGVPMPHDPNSNIRRLST